MQKIIIMLSSINWQTYWTTTAFTLAAYYFVVLVLLYQKEILNLLTGKTTNKKQPYPAPPIPGLMGTTRETASERNEEPEQPKTLSTEDIVFSDTPPPDDPYDDEAGRSDAFDALEQLSVELKSLMEDYGKKGNRTELLRLIRGKLNIYSETVDSGPFKESINHFVTEQCRNRCGVRIEPADLKALWSKEPL